MSFCGAFFILIESVYKSKISVPWIEGVQPTLVHLELHIWLALRLLADNEYHIVASVGD